MGGVDPELNLDKLALVSLQRCLDREEFGFKTPGVNWLDMAKEQLSLVDEAGYAIARFEINRRLEAFNKEA